MALTSPNTFQGVLLGSKSAGKSTILKCGLQGEPFVEGGCAPTYGPECLTMQSPVPPQAGDKSGTPPSQLTVLIWDCPGSEQFALSAMQYLRSQDSIFIVADSSDAKSVQSALTDWLRIVVTHKLDDSNVVFVLSKSDLVPCRPTVQLQAEIQQAVKEQGLPPAPVYVLSCVGPHTQVTTQLRSVFVREGLLARSRKLELQKQKTSTTGAPKSPHVHLNTTSYPPKPRRTTGLDACCPG